MLELLFLRGLGLGVGVGLRLALGLGLGLGRFGVILGRIVDSVGRYVGVLVSQSPQYVVIPG